jgi:hypothetical protein
MVGTTTCDAAQCEKTTDAILRITRPSWMVEQVPSVDCKTEDVSLCSRHADGFGGGVTADVELIAGRR